MNKNIAVYEKKVLRRVKKSENQVTTLKLLFSVGIGFESSSML